MKIVRWTPEDDARFKTLAGTMPAADIAKIFNRSTHAIIARGVVLKTPVGFKRTPTCRQRWPEIKALIDEGLSLPRIAERLGLKYHNMRQRVFKMGVKPLVDGRGCKVGRGAPKERTPKQANNPVRKVEMVVSRLAKCECGLWVVNTFEGWARHRACVHSRRVA